jgi:LAO/AO transport system kinase
LHALLERIIKGDRRAVARALTIIENDGTEKEALLQSMYPYAGSAHVVGFTGSPGAGKSTLVDQVITLLRARGQTVGVLAVDPSSPFTGGALLGDRVRMSAHSGDKGVYIRSVGSRGNLGGLSKSTREMLYALEAFGCDVILLETVGVGQSELDILTVADTNLLVLTPGSGDHVQTAKAGIMEIADIYVVNKNEIPGSDTLVRELQLMIRDKSAYREDWKPKIVRTSAASGEGIEKMWAAALEHLSHLKAGGYRKKRMQERHLADTIRIVEERFHRYAAQMAYTDESLQTSLGEESVYDPYQSAALLLKKMPWLHV